MITINRLNELLICDSDNGILYWKKDSFIGFKSSALAHRSGSVAGTRRTDGRLVIRLDKKLYMAYRVIWAISKGEFPNGEIDHINGDKTDNRIDNLRDVNRKTNAQNIRIPLSGRCTDSVLGVYLDKRKKNKKWRACIQVNGRQKSLGYYLTQSEAENAYITAKRELHDGCTI